MSVFNRTHYQPRNRSNVRMNRGTLVVGMAGAVPFVMDHNLTSDLEDGVVPDISYTTGHPIQVMPKGGTTEDNGMIGYGEEGISRLMVATGQVSKKDTSTISHPKEIKKFSDSGGNYYPGTLTKMYKELTDGLNEVPEKDHLMLFPYDPTGYFPFMIGDVFRDRTGDEYTVVGFRWKEDHEALFARVMRNGIIKDLEVGYGWLKHDDIQYFRLCRRSVVDWESYLTIMAQWACDSGETLKTVDDLGTKAPENGKDRTVALYDAVRHFHEWSCRKINHDPSYAVIKTLEAKDHTNTEELGNLFEDYTIQLWRIYANGYAKGVVKEIISKENEDEGYSLNVSDSNLVTTLDSSRYAATRLKRFRPDADLQPSRTVSTGYTIGGDISKNIRPVYVREHIVFERISDEKPINEQTSPVVKNHHHHQQDEEEEDIDPEMETFDFLESM